jgi:hypothetical protein
MPDIQEVYEMVTKQTPPKLDALERQHRRQERTYRTRKVAAIAVVTVIALIAVALVLGERARSNRTTPASPSPTDEVTATSLARDFTAAFSSFDAEHAMSYVSDDADLSHLIDGQVADDVHGMRLMVGLLDAFGYDQRIRTCGTATAGSDVFVNCDIDFNAIRSDEIGKGPYRGHLSFTVRQGAIVWASIDWNLTKFSPQMWEPFRDWVRNNHPHEFDAMFIDDGGNFRLTPRSIDLWRTLTKAYVRDVNGSA